VIRWGRVLTLWILVAGSNQEQLRDWNPKHDSDSGTPRSGNVGVLQPLLLRALWLWVHPIIRLDIVLILIHPIIFVVAPKLRWKPLVKEA